MAATYFSLGVFFRMVADDYSHPDMGKIAVQAEDLLTRMRKNWPEQEWAESMPGPPHVATKGGLKKVSFAGTGASSKAAQRTRAKWSIRNNTLGIKPSELTGQGKVSCPIVTPPTRAGIRRATTSLVGLDGSHNVFSTDDPSDEYIAVLRSMDQIHATVPTIVWRLQDDGVDHRLTQKKVRGTESAMRVEHVGSSEQSAVLDESAAPEESATPEELAVPEQLPAAHTDSHPPTAARAPMTRPVPEGGGFMQAAYEWCRRVPFMLGCSNVL